jgi:uncharacterized membrane protein
MEILTRLALLSPLDAAGLLFLVLCWLALGHAVENPPAARPSVASLMSAYRRDWMKEFVSRESRIYDAQIIDNLRQGTAFFASTTLIAIGGGMALVGNADLLTGLARGFSVPLPRQLVELKLLVVLVFVANALFKFIWAHRLFAYCAILMSAVPNDPGHPQAYHRSAQAAEVNIAAARAFNRGLRSIYFSVGALGWLVGPWALIGATVVTTLLQVRREFASQSRAVILRHDQSD